MEWVWDWETAIITGAGRAAAGIASGVVSQASDLVHHPLKTLAKAAIPPVGIYNMLKDSRAWSLDITRRLADKFADGDYFGALETASEFAAAIAAGTLVDKMTGASTGGSTKTDRILGHLTDADLSAARREANGEVVARKSDGTPWDHVHEVRDAQRGLLKRIQDIKRQLQNSALTPEAREGLVRELGKASRALDRSEGYLPR
jgi:hypothetical protein